MLDTKRLRILREVAQAGSFSAAAETLYMSQSAVSQQIATLEREVGMKLLERTREGPKPTEAGRVLVVHAEAAIARLDEAERELAAIAGLEGGELRLASFASASATLLTKAVSIFHGRHPKVRLSVAEAEPEDSLPRLRAGELDLALSYDYESVPAEPDRDLELTLVLEESMHLALRRDDPLAKRKKVKLADLSDREWLNGGTNTCGELVLGTCRDAGFEPRMAFESDDYHVLQGFIAAGLGVTLLPDLALATLRADLVVRPTDPDASKRRVWAATRAEGARSPAAEEMLGILVEVGERFSQRTAQHLSVAA